VSAKTRRFPRGSAVVSVCHYPPGILDQLPKLLGVYADRGCHPALTGSLLSETAAIQDPLGEYRSVRRGDHLGPSSFCLRGNERTPNTPEVDHMPVIPAGQAAEGAGCKTVARLMASGARSADAPLPWDGTN
jgi:hypothetical protein